MSGIQLFPSHQEGTPSTLFESMAVGNVAVASTADGQGEVLEEGRTALLFEPGDIDRMTAQLERAMSDEVLRGLLRKESLREIQKYDMQQCLETLERTYEKMAGRS